MKMSLTLLLTSGLLITTGCAENKPAPQKIIKTEQVKKEVVYRKQSLSKEEIENAKSAEIYNELPEWIRNNGYTKDGLGAVGVAKKEKYRTISFLKRIAQQDALNNLANQIKAEVVPNYIENIDDMTENDKRAFKQHIENSFKSSSKINISGARIINSYMSRDKNLYVMAVISERNHKKYKQRLTKKLDEEKAKFIK